MHRFHETRPKQSLEENTLAPPIPNEPSSAVWPTIESNVPHTILPILLCPPPCSGPVRQMWITVVHPRSLLTIQNEITI